MTEMQVLKLRIEKLEKIVCYLTGMQEGAISDMDFMKACECGDRLTQIKYWDQQLGRTGNGP